MGGWRKRLTLSGAVLAVYASFALPADALRTQSGGAGDNFDATNAVDTIMVARPNGTISVSDVSIDAHRVLHVTVTDTRAGDRGWSVVVDGDIDGWSPAVVDHTAPLTAGSGRSYAQQVTLGGRSSSVLAWAPSGHGLGLAHLSAALPPGCTNVTVSVV